MGRSSGSSNRLRAGFLQEIGGRLGYVSVPQYQRQHSIGRKHDLLWILSFYICEPDLGWNSGFFDRGQKAAFFSLHRYKVIEILSHAESM